MDEEMRQAEQEFERVKSTIQSRLGKSIVEAGNQTADDDTDGIIDFDDIPFE